jgi:DNA-binding SARP family transcriptional activator
MDAELVCRVLGPLEILVDGRQVHVGGPREKKLLVTLLVNAGRAVPTAQLIDSLWGERPPNTAARQVNNAVVALRRNVGRSVIVTDGPGYRVDVPRESVDMFQFDAGYERGRKLLAAGELRQAIGVATEALALARRRAGRHHRRHGGTRGRAARRTAPGHLRAAHRGAPGPG